MVRLPWHNTLFLVTQITHSHSAFVSVAISVLLQLRQVVTYPVWLIYTTIMRLFRNPQPAITLKDPEVKYALRLIDKEVGACAVLSVTSLHGCCEMLTASEVLGGYFCLEERTL